MIHIKLLCTRPFFLLPHYLNPTHLSPKVDDSQPSPLPNRHTDLHALFGWMDLGHGGREDVHVLLQQIYTCTHNRREGKERGALKTSMHPGYHIERLCLSVMVRTETCACAIALLLGAFARALFAYAAPSPLVPRFFGVCTCSALSVTRFHFHFLLPFLFFSHFFSSLPVLFFPFGAPRQMG